MTTQLEDLVVLLDEAGQPIGTAPREGVHGFDTPLHLAFSCYVFDADGRVLWTRRSATKRSWPGSWTNSFCGHPRPGEAVEVAVRRHAAFELDLELDTLVCALPDFRYSAVDAAGVIENEVCPTYVATSESAVQPNPDEVADWEWRSWSDVVDTAHRRSSTMSPWSALQVPQLDGWLSRRSATGSQSRNSAPGSSNRLD